ncbi:membrane dipeptidase-domain-containing protein [Cokeromyces recurvatus]|uniref:membrane dipeptidase-domain-containing protein n=1 Tax=Cokeromyces recurvatus TaxID=90255 RepID=UPI00222116AA|nr:membrane dipeptidase-domain-containing protein [Cokeromyces recurvatus]XP_051384470.1 membrane dipeptidase-domain-containing protein [Cokeromyces recurvatus]KAI7897854.1 membrane dipeptidase-domain-containing protein [Cokeromyces recurvatus]KAI7904485.1 membrane dipeptidase-domain-containing protein [Cokeromyces recurvatus]
MEYITNLFLQDISNPTIEYDGQNHIFRHRQAEHGFIDTPLFPKLRKEECTIDQLWGQTVNANMHKPVFGYRPLKNIYYKESKSSPNEGKPKKWSYFELGDYEWMSYREANEKIQKIASILQRHGLQHGDIVILFSKTRAEWMMTALACLTLGLVITTAYDSMPADSINHIIKETEAKAIFTETSLFKTLNKAYEKLEKKDQPKFVFYAGHEFEAPEEVQKFKNGKADEVNMVHIDTIITDKNQEQVQVQVDEKPQPNDLALIMYTSGSTGAPKGVELTHANIIAAIGSAEYLVIDFLKFGNHSYIGFLPLAHVLEFLVELIMISFTIPIGYGSIRTLMNDFVCGPDGKGKGEGDLKALKPTIMAGVPAVWEKIKKGIDAQLNKQHWAVKKVFEAAIEMKWKMLNFFGKPNSITNLYDSIIFGAIRDVTGGRLQYGLSGGAPVSFETQKFITSTLCYMLQGYGLTECCGLGAVTLPSLGITTGVIGPPSPSIEFRFVDVPDTDYKAENNVGELWLRGPSLLRGYYKRPDLTNEAITPDGWFKTGDIAILKPDGTFAITDRAKNLVKLAHGEYVALENLESKYRNCSSIKNICLIADSNKSYIVGVVEPVDNNADKETILKDLQQSATSSGCSRVEIVKDIVVTRNKDWLKEYMTTTGKVKPFDGLAEQAPFSTRFYKKQDAIDHAHKLLGHNPVIDTHNDLPLHLAFVYNGKINHLNFTHFDWGHTDIERLRRGQVGGEFWSIYYECEDSKANQVLKAMENIDVIKRMINLYPDTFHLAVHPKEFQRAMRRGKIASAMGIEGGQMIANSMVALRQLYEAGARYMTLTHNSFEKGLGLTEFGKEIVREMNRLGMMVDISHVAHSTMHAVLNVTRAPVLFSHSSSHALCPIERNVPDAVLKRLHETDGVVMVNFYNAFVQCTDPTRKATLSDVADHIEHIAAVAGHDRVGLGADYNGIEETPVGLEDVSKYPDLFAELIRRGWSDDDLIGLAGKNFLRVWKKVELVKRKLAKLGELPSESRIEDYN